MILVRVYILILLVVYSLSGCATVATNPPVVSPSAIDLKSFCESNAVSSQWDHVNQIITLKKNNMIVNLLMGSDLVSVDGEKSLLSAPIRVTKSVVFVPADLKDKVSICFLKKSPSCPKIILQPKTVREVMVDPGHGGKDPGAMGKSGLREKDVVLDIAKRVRRILTEHNVKVRMTRTKDEFISLAERTEMASASKADLFVSIHVNSSPTKNVHGVEVYSSKDLDPIDKKEDQRLSNHRILFKHLKMVSSSPTLESIVSDMYYNQKQAESRTLSSRTAKKTSSLLHAENLGSKYARFYVLRNTLIPAILVEGGFLSNPKEERLLGTPEYRQKLAYGIARSILDYLNYE